MQNIHLVSKICRSFCIKKPSSLGDFKIMDVNIEQMMCENIEPESNYNTPAASETFTPSVENSVMEAPTDINAWANEFMEKAGTLDMEYVEKLNEEIHYPEPPKDRSGLYTFEGIKIWLPQKMLTPATYRYRLDEGEEETLPDDIRICRFENFKPSS